MVIVFKYKAWSDLRGCSKFLFHSQNVDLFFITSNVDKSLTKSVVPKLFYSTEY